MWCTTHAHRAGETPQETFAKRTSPTVDVKYSSHTQPITSTRTQISMLDAWRVMNSSLLGGAPLGHNIEIRGKGRGTTWEEYFTSTVPGGPSFPQTKHLHLTDMRACLTDGPLLRSPQKSSGGRAMVVHGKNILRLRYPGGRRFPRQRAGSAGPARPGRPGGPRWRYIATS